MNECRLYRCFQNAETATKRSNFRAQNGVKNQKRDPWFLPIKNISWDLPSGSTRSVPIVCLRKSPQDGLPEGANLHSLNTELSPFAPLWSTWKILFQQRSLSFFSNQSDGTQKPVDLSNYDSSSSVVHLIERPYRSWPIRVFVLTDELSSARDQRMVR